MSCIRQKLLITLSAWGVIALSLGLLGAVAHATPLEDKRAEAAAVADQVDELDRQLNELQEQHRHARNELRTIRERVRELTRQLRLAMLVNGVDLSGWPGGLTSLAHGPEDVQATAEAFRESLLMLRRERLA